MKREAITANIIGTFLIIILLLSLSFIIAKAQPTTVSFSVNLTLSGNAAPSITWIETPSGANPVESSTRTIYINFNATDNNGYNDINYSSARITLTLSGEPVRTSSVCTNTGNTSLTMMFNCTISLQYYDRDGNWAVNASVKDLQNSYIDDTSKTFAYGSLQAVRANLNGITFGSISLSQQTGASNDPLILNNTGNQNFTEINITAYNLVGQNTPSQYIDVSNIYVNASQDNFGNSLVNKTMVKLTNGTLSRDISGTDHNRNLYFWISVPAAGLSNQNYISSTNWLLEVFP
jgi:hypothetical protein